MLIGTIHDLSRLQNLKEHGLDAILVGIQYFSIRQTITLTKEQLSDCVQKAHTIGLKVYVNALRFFMEDELESLSDFLDFCHEVQVDGLYYSDEGLYALAKEKNMESLLVYQPETLITNHEDIAFYESLGIQAVSLAHECSLEEILLMTQQHKDVEILISGYFSILYSRRMLVTNYLHSIDSTVSGHDHRFDLIESTRDERMPVIEDDYGTHIFSESPIQTKEELPILKAHGLHRFRIDSSFFDDDWMIQVLDAYQGNDMVPGSNRWYHQETIRKKEDGQ